MVRIKNFVPALVCDFNWLVVESFLSFFHWERVMYTSLEIKMSKIICLLWPQEMGPFFVEYFFPKYIFLQGHFPELTTTTVHKVFSLSSKNVIRRMKQGYNLKNMKSLQMMLHFDIHLKYIDFWSFSCRVGQKRDPSSWLPSEHPCQFDIA